MQQQILHKAFYLSDSLVILHCVTVLFLFSFVGRTCGKKRQQSTFFLAFFIMYVFKITLGFIFWLQEHFGNSASLSVGPPGLLLNGTGDLVERQFRKSRVHNGGALANYSTFDMGSLWTDMDPDNAEYRRNVQNCFMSNIQKMNINRDLNASYMSDSDLSDALSGLKLSNNRVMDEWNHGDELLDELLKRQRDFCTKIGDGNRTPLVGNAFCSPRSDLRPPPIYGDGILRRQTSALDGSNVSRMNRHHLKDVDHLSLAEQLAMMRSGNLPRGVNLSPMSNMINPMENRYNNNSIRDLAYVRNRRAFLEDLLAQEYLQDDNLLYNDSRIHHDEPRSPCARMQRSGSHFHPNPRNIQSHGDRQPRLFSFNRKATGRNIGSQFYHDNTLANYLDVPSLDNEDRSGADSVDLIDVMGRIKDVRQVFLSFCSFCFPIQISFISLVSHLMQYGSIWEPVYSAKTRKCIT